MKGPSLPPPLHGTLNDALAAAAAGSAGLTFVALDESERHVSFRDVRDRAARTAAALRAAGVAAGDRVAIVLPTSPSFMDAFFGSLAAGAVPVPLYPPLRLGRLDEYHAATAAMLSAVEARLVLTDHRAGKLLGRAVERARPELGWRDTAAFTAGRTEADEADVGPDDTALIQFSSGSTTDPKPVALTHRQLVAQLSALRALMPEPTDSGQLGVSWLPLYHDMGLIGCLLLAVTYPGPLVLIPPEHFLARPALWLRAIARHRATLSVSPPFGYALAARRAREAELEGLDLSSWRLAVCGAEPISLGALHTFAQRFAAYGFDPAALRPVYGLAEAALGVTFAPAGRAPRSLAVDPVRLASTGEVARGGRTIVSVGAPVPGFEVEVRGDDGRPLPERRVGRIHARGPSVMAGYFRQARPTAQTVVDGWLDTGDLGFVADGELYVSGRAKDVIVIRGANHSPQEFEECLEGIAGLRPGCCVALGFIPQDEDAEQLLILAERAAGGRPVDDGLADTAELVRRTVLERTGIRPHTVRLLAPGTLPRTSSGKMRRSEALRRFLTDRLDRPHSSGPLRLAAELARSAWAFARLRLDRGRRT